PGVLARELLDERLGRLAEDGRELLRRLDRVLDEVRGRAHVGGRLGDGERVALAVDDRAAGGRELGARDLLGGGGARERPGADAAETEGAGARDEQGDEERGANAADTALEQRHPLLTPLPGDGGAARGRDGPGGCGLG